MHAESDADWVPAAVARDIPDGTVIPADLSLGRIAVWRSASGKLFANADRCPHRGMRLSHGFVRGESLSCIYHGWRYGPDGACEHIPAHPGLKPPKSINCGPLPVRERNGVVWVATNRPETEPTDFTGREALRSMAFAASAATITRVADGEMTDGGAVAVKLGDAPALLLMDSNGPGQCFVIALVAAGSDTADRVRASAAFEALRRAAEASEGDE